MDKPLDNVVLSRMKNFAAMNKLKKTALMVVGSCLSAEEIAGMKRLFKTIDADGSGTITVKELQARPRASARLDCLLEGAIAGGLLDPSFFSRANVSGLLVRRTRSSTGATRSRRRR